MTRIEVLKAIRILQQVITIIIVLLFQKKWVQVHVVTQGAILHQVSYALMLLLKYHLGLVVWYVSLYYI